MTVTHDDIEVWACKIIIPKGSPRPFGFDGPPRRAAIAAIEAAGVHVLGCSSGWGAHLTDAELVAYHAQQEQSNPDVYVAGALDADETMPQ